MLEAANTSSFTNLITGPSSLPAEYNSRGVFLTQLHSGSIEVDGPHLDSEARMPHDILK